MILKAACKYADSKPPVGAVTRDSFKDGAFWACEKILSALSLAWGFKKRDGEYLEVLREIINRIEGHDNVPVK